MPSRMRKLAPSCRLAALLLVASLLVSRPAGAVSTTVTLSAPGPSAIIPIDSTKPPATALLVNVPNGVTASCQVEISGGRNGPWNAHDTLVGLTTSANGNLAFILSFVRLNCASLSGGSVSLTAIQGDTEYPLR